MARLALGGLAMRLRARLARPAGALQRLLPRSLVGRVHALYVLTLAVFVGGGLLQFHQVQFATAIEDAQLRADALVEVATPAVADSAVIGDYDTIQRMLERALHHADFASAAFIDVKGGVARSARDDPPDVRPPRWLAAAVAERLYDINRTITVGGKDYGVLRLSFAPERIASGLWRQARDTLLLALASLVAGLLLIRWPLKHWLGQLERLQAFEHDFDIGGPGAPASDNGDTPTELRRTFDVLSRAAASMQVQREQAATTLAAIGDGVLTLDMSGQVTFSNPAARTMLGLDEAALLQRRVVELLPELFECAVPTDTWHGRRVACAAADGTSLMLDTTLSAVAGRDGRVAGYVLACRDVTEQHALQQRMQQALATREAAMAAMRRLLESIMPQARSGERDDIGALSHLIAEIVARLQERGAQLDAIFALSPDAFVSFDGARRVAYTSPAFSALTGLAAAEVSGRDEAGFLALLTARCTRGAQALPSLAALREDGTARAGAAPHRHLLDIEWPSRRVLQLALREGAGAGVVSQVLLIRDVTHETEVDQMKSEFLSTAAHELRTPMASVYGFSELMLTRKLSPERQRDVIETVHRQSGRMIAILNELLDLARIEARRGKDFSIELLDADALVADVLRDFRPPEGRAAPTVTTAGTSLHVRGDRGKLTQALNNVLSNAYKYSPGGGPVEVAIDSGERVTIEVRDHGIGMTPEQLSRVCERFYRADASGAIPGTGLGMSIVREIVELHAGQLTLASEPGRGTTVTLRLPRAAVEQPALLPA